MRIVRHPNIVELKAFFYNNGERVCFRLEPLARGQLANCVICRRTRSI